MFDGLDFRSEDGLYALLSSLQEQDIAAPAAVGVAGCLSSCGDVSLDKETRGRRRSGRIATIGSSNVKTNEAEGYDIVDPQEIMDITVFRTHPEVF